MGESLEGYPSLYLKRFWKSMDRVRTCGNCQLMKQKHGRARCKLYYHGTLTWDFSNPKTFVHPKAWEEAKLCMDYKEGRDAEDIADVGTLGV